MEVTLEVVQHQLAWGEILSRVLVAEEAGFDGAWVFDHLKPISGDPEGPCLEGWTLLAALGARTSRIRLGTLVTGMTYRNPSLLAMEAITVDHVTNGRLNIGVGAAWFEGEHREFGLPFPGTRERADRLEEGVQVVRALMTQDNVTFEGAYYRLEEATFRPRPIQQPHPPIWIGAMGAKLMLPVVARQADVWHASAPLEEMVSRAALLDRYAEEAGRDPASIARAGSFRLSDSPDDVRRTVHGLRDAGFRYLVGVWPDDGIHGVRRFAETLLPELQSL